jgi:hypothetical protein
MYQINRKENNIIKLEQMKFGELGFREREHLQEWIAKNPDILGEELLIIQKEFNGFNDTNERLDLLALDKDSNLVIIENKLDDSGRDVTWQALKYTSYCSTLSTSQIVKMFQDYLDKYCDGEDAKETIVEFLELENDEDLLLNKNDQRIMFVASNYRKEVTSTVLWLINHDINIQCFKATPYKLNNDLFLQIDQIIPVPEIEEFMIDVKEKKQEEKTKGTISSETDRLLVEFWKKLKMELINHNIHHLDNVTPKSHFHIGFSKGRGLFGFVFGKKSQRVELYFHNDIGKKLFDSMKKYQSELENNFEGQIIWERLDNKKASRIKYEMLVDEARKVGKFKDIEHWDEKVEWFVKSFEKFYKVVYPIWEKAQKDL